MKRVSLLSAALAFVLMGALVVTAFEEKNPDVVSELKVQRITFVNERGETIGTLGPAPEVLRDFLGYV